MADPFNDGQNLDLWRAGNEQGARHLYDHYAQQLLGLVKRRISQRLASRVDPEDVVQSVFRTFFQRTREGRLNLTDPNDLGALLVRIAIHKTLRQVEFNTADKRDFGQEMAQGFDLEKYWESRKDRDPTPDEAVAFLDQMEHFLGRLKPKERKIVEMRVQGYSSDEIAQAMETNDRYVRRVLERVRGLAEQEDFGGR
jgi:RNA polymerase sigma-70 factor (ECF subfamily)